MPWVSATLYREALEKLLVNGVEKTLFLGEIVDGGSGAFNGAVESVKIAKKIVSAERLGGEGINHLLDFYGDDVTASEIGIVEDGAEDAFG